MTQAVITFGLHGPPCGFLTRPRRLAGRRPRLRRRSQRPNGHRDGVPDPRPITRAGWPHGKWEPYGVAWANPRRQRRYYIVTDYGRHRIETTLDERRGSLHIGKVRAAIPHDRSSPGSGRSPYSARSPIAALRDQDQIQRLRPVFTLTGPTLLCSLPPECGVGGSRELV